MEYESAHAGAAPASPAFPTRQQSSLIIGIAMFGPSAAALLAVYVLPWIAVWVGENRTLLLRVALGILVLAIIVALALPTFLSFLRREGDLDGAGRGTRLASRKLAYSVALGLTVLSLTQAIASSLVAARVDRHFEHRLPGVEGFYRNHDLAGLVGQSIRMQILRWVDDPDPQDGQSRLDPSDRKNLVRLAHHASDAWVELVFERNADLGWLTQLTDPNLIDFVADRERPALEPESWERLLSGWEVELGAPLRYETRKELSKEISTSFGVSLREVLKHDFVHGGEGFAALWLDLQGRLLQNALGPHPVGGSQVAEALEELQAEMPRLDGLLATLRAEQSAGTSDIVARIDGVNARLADRLAGIAAETTATRVNTEEIKRDTTEIKAGQEDLARAVDELRGPRDPVRARATNQGLDIDLVGPDDFEIDFYREYGHAFFSVRSDPALEALIFDGYLQFRVRSRPWQTVVNSVSDGRLVGYLYAADFEAEGPLELQFAALGAASEMVTHGPYELPVDPSAEILALVKRSVERNDGWLVYQYDHWTIENGFAAELDGFAEALVIGTGPEETRLTIPFPQLEGGDRQKHREALNTLAERCAEPLEELTTIAELYGRVRFLDGSTGAATRFEAPKDAVQSAAMKPGAMTPRLASEIFSAPDFVPGTLRHGSLVLGKLGAIRQVLKEVRVRRVPDEPSRSFPVVSPDETGKLSDPAPRDALVYAGSGTSYQAKAHVRVPRHWTEVTLEALLIDGTILSRRVEADRETPAMGFQATPTGPGAEAAPALYVTYQGGRFEFTPWHPEPLEDLVVEPQEIRHAAEVVEARMVAPDSTEAQTFTYSMEGLEHLRGHLPPSFFVARLEPELEYRTTMPAVAVDLSADGTLLAVTTSEGVVHLVRTGSEEEPVTIEAGEYAGKSYGAGGASLSPDGTRVVVFVQSEGDGSHRIEGDWSLFAAQTGEMVATLTYSGGSTPEAGRRPVFQEDMVWFRTARRINDRPAPSVEMLQSQTGVWSVRDGRLLLEPDQEHRHVLGAVGASTVITLSPDQTTVRLVGVSVDPPRTLTEVVLDRRLESYAIAPNASALALKQQGEQAVTVHELPSLEQRFRVHSEGGGRIPSFTRDASSVLVRPRLTGREHELVDARSGESVFRYARQESELVSPSLCWRSAGRGSSVELLRVPSMEPVEHLPYDAHASDWDLSAFGLDREDFMLWTRTPPGNGSNHELFFIDLEIPRTLQLMSPAGSTCQGCVASEDGSVLAAVRSDGVAVRWLTR